MGEQKEGGRVVYSRPEGGDGRARTSTLQKVLAAGGDYHSLWRTLVPLLVGFALLVGLVLGLGYMSRRRVRVVTYGLRDVARRLEASSETLLNLRLALSRLDTEARIRGRVEAGTGGVTLPPTDLRLRNERGDFDRLVEEFDRLPLSDAALKREVHDRAAEYSGITRDARLYSLKGFESARELDARLRALMKGVGEERAQLEVRRYETIEAAEKDIMRLMWLAAAVALVVATATFLEVWRRFRQMRRGYAALRRERQFSAQMLEGMPSAVAAIDRGDRIRSANAAFFGVFPGASVGGSIHDKFAGPEGLKLLAAATSTRVRSTAYRGRYHMPADGGGKEHAYDVYSSPLEIDGELGQLLTLVDATEAAESEQELRRSESLAAVGQAAAQVAHEI
ncbi:MAG TPA: hypothetical protein VF736_22755, partial [Pyrinomonadaceae bacterium]